MSKIVADGKERYLEANRGALELQRKELEAAVMERYEAELSKAGFWRRLVLRVKMKRELRAGQRSSDESLYWTEST